MSPEGDRQNRAVPRLCHQANEEPSPTSAAHSCVALTSGLLPLRLSLRTCKMGVEHLPGSVVRINRDGVVVSTVGAQWFLPLLQGFS